MIRVPGRDGQNGLTVGQRGQGIESILGAVGHAVEFGAPPVPRSTHIGSQ